MLVAILLSVKQHRDIKFVHWFNLKFGYNFWVSAGGTMCVLHALKSICSFYAFVKRAYFFLHFAQRMQGLPIN